MLRRSATTGFMMAPPLKSQAAVGVLLLPKVGVCQAGYLLI